MHIIQMSKLSQNTNFDFQILNNQGAYLSSYTPKSIAQCFQPIDLPEHSSYHLVGCYNPPLMAKCNIEPILINYLNASSKANHQIIIDLCLPFHHKKSGRMFMGRYIIFKGQLIGIRLSTATNTLNSSFFSWPRHRAKLAKISILGKDSNILIGQICLNLLNVRIGLMFQSQIETSSQQYMNYGFDFIALAYQATKHKQSTIAIKNDLAKSMLFLEADLGNIDNIIKQSNIKRALVEAQSNPLQSKVKINIEYCRFQKRFQNKNRLYLSENQLSFITMIEINTSFMRKNIKNIKISYPTYNLQFQNFSIDRNPQNNDMQKYLKRIYLYYYHSGFKKVIVKGQQTPLFICFLFILEKLIQQYEKEQNFSIRQIFQFIGLNNNELANILSKFKIVRFQKRFQDREQDETIYLVRVFNYILEHQREQNIFPVITNDQQLITILRMLNQREIIRLLRGQLITDLSENQSLESDTDKAFGLKTWTATDFFTKKQLKQIYFSAQVKQIMNNPQHHLEVWNKFDRRRQICGQEADKMKKVILQQFLQKDSLFMKQFLQHYEQIKSFNYKYTKQIIFAHFLLKKMTKLQQSQAMPNLMAQILITPPSEIFKLFKFFSHQKISPLQNLSTRIALNYIAFARQQSSHKNKCHKCELSFFPQLMYKCKTQICSQSFCYQCMLNFKCFQPHLLHLDNSTQCLNNIKLCPICRGFCLNCKKCQAKKISLQQPKQKWLNLDNPECHYCKRGNCVYQYKCSVKNCHKQFCLQCIQEKYRVRSNQYMKSNWICFACENRCYCNNCELQKAKLMSLLIDRPNKKQKQENEQRRRNEKNINQQQYEPIATRRRGSQKINTQRMDELSITKSAVFQNNSREKQPSSDRGSEKHTNKRGRKPKKAQIHTQQEKSRYEQQQETRLQNPKKRNSKIARSQVIPARTYE